MMSPRRIGLRHLTLCAAFIVLMFANDEENSVLYQVIGVALICMSGVLYSVFGSYRRIVFSQFDVVIFVISTFSILSATINQDSYVLIFTLIFLSTYFAIMSITQNSTREELLHVLKISIELILLLVVVLYWDVLLSTLTPGAAKRWELRWAPFNMHPNLAGFIYGGFAVIIWFTPFAASWRGAYAKAVLVGLCIAIILAASARAGLLALVLTFSLYTVHEILSKKGTMKYIIPVFAAACIAGLFFFESIQSYLTEILELDSKSRGLDSGGSGRIELWQIGIEYLSNRGWELFIGSGIRSASEAKIGFFSESSYINIMIEHGVFLSLIVLYRIYKIIYISYKLQSLDGGFFGLALYALIFALLQSVFNRYLIAIGNPFSIIVLMVLAKVSAESRSILNSQCVTFGDARMRRWVPSKPAP